MIGWLIGWLVRSLVLIGRLGGLLGCWLVGWLVDWLVDCVGFLFGWSVGVFGYCPCSFSRSLSPINGCFRFRRWIVFGPGQAMGVITGSDTRPDRTLSRSLSVLGMQVCGCVCVSMSHVCTKCVSMICVCIHYFCVRMYPLFMLTACSIHHVCIHSLLLVCTRMCIQLCSYASMIFVPVPVSICVCSLVLIATQPLGTLRDAKGRRYGEVGILLFC